MLLRRYGVVFREMIARETIVPRWRELLIAFRRLEDQGQIRGGRFRQRLPRRAIRVARSSRIAARQRPSTSFAQESVTLAAADPLNLVGIIIPGERVSSASGKTVTLLDGVLAETEESVRRYA